MEVGGDNKLWLSYDHRRLVPEKEEGVVSTQHTVAHALHCTGELTDLWRQMLVCYPEAGTTAHTHTQHARVALGVSVGVRLSVWRAATAYGGGLFIIQVYLG